MRWLIPLTAFAALALAETAAAAPVSVGEVSIGSHLQSVLEHKLGTQEGPVLERMVSDAVASALQRAGADVQPGSGVTVETVILDAKPNTPTDRQLEDQPGLSPIQSISAGGARLHGVVRGANGQVLAEIDHSRYSNSVADVVPSPTQWMDAQRAFRQYADKVARAYQANVH